MIEKKTKSRHFGPRQPYYLESETGREFRRILGGMAWPEAKPGFLVVVGEELDVDKDLEKHKYWVLAEYENHSPSDLIRRCKEYKSIFKIDSIYGDTANLPMMAFMRGSEFHLSDAPFADAPTAVQYYRSLIREMTTITRKILTFGESSKLPEILSTFDVDRFSEFPAAMALGYVLAALKEYSYYNPYEYYRDIMPEPEAAY